MDWNRFQLVSLGIIAGLIAIRAFFLWFTIRVNAFKIAQPGELFFVVGAALFVLFLLRAAQVVVLPMPAFSETMIVDSTIARSVGAWFVVAGVLILVLALLSFGNSWRIGIDTRTPGQLVTTGIFAFSRNPIFAFMDLYLVGTFLINGTPVFLIIALMGVIGLHVQILREESFLRARHGAAYREYCAKTRRYF
jgi:protein-S-isoprenylcysteine O-methyltransferase Ste14